MKLLACFIVILCWGFLSWAQEQAADPIIESTVQSRWPMIQRCYQSQLRKGAVGDGKIVVGFQTSLRGYVKKAWIQESTINNEIVKRCAIYRFKKLKFQLDGSKALRGFYPIKFTAKTSSLPKYNQPLSDQQAKLLIDQAVQNKWPKFKKCYLKEKIRNSVTKTGEVLINFVVNENGKVSYTAVKQSTLQNKNIETCIVDLFRSMRLEKPLHRIINGIYPITYK